MSSELQEFLIRGMLGDAGFVGAAVVARNTMSRFAPIVSVLGEPTVYVSMVADLLVCPAFSGVAIEHVVADGGRYPAQIMTQIPDQIMDCTTPKGFVHRVQFKHSHEDPGLQLVDVLSNHIYRRVRDGAAGVDGTELLAEGHRVTVYPASLEHSVAPEWMMTLPQDSESLIVYRI